MDSSKVGLIAGRYRPSWMFWLYEGPAARRGYIENCCTGTGKRCSWKRSEFTKFEMTIIFDGHPENSVVPVRG